MKKRKERRGASPAARPQEAQPRQTRPPSVERASGAPRERHAARDRVGGHWEVPLIVALCLVAALRVFLFAAAFPLFNNIDEDSQVDTVLKYARGYWPVQSAEQLDPATERLVVLYGALDYFNPPERFRDGVVPPPLHWQRPPLPDQVVRAYAAQKAATQVNNEAHSPPVYYVVASEWYRLVSGLGVGDGQRIYWLRFLGAPLSALLVWLGHVVCRQWYPGRQDLRLGVPILLAFVPQDVFYSVNADVLSPLLFAGSLALLLTWYRRERPGAALSAGLGLLVALTFLVKYTNLALPAIFGAAVAFKLRRRGWVERQAVLIALLAALLPVAMWFGRNYILLGDFAGTQSKILAVGYTSRPLGAWLTHPIFTPRGLGTFWAELMRTFWRGEIVWHLERIASPAADMFYVISSTVLLLAAAVAWGRRRLKPAGELEPDRGADATADALVWAAVIASVLTLAVLSVSFSYEKSWNPSQAHPYFSLGRLMGGALIPFFILYVEGLAILMRPIAPVIGSVVCASLTAVVMTVSEVALTWRLFANPYNWFHLR